MVKYNGVMYTYVHNLQGDIVAGSGLTTPPSNRYNKYVTFRKTVRPRGKQESDEG